MKICPRCQTSYASGDYCQTDGAPLEALPEQDPLLGSVLQGAYRIEQNLSEGAMSMVYLARQLTLDRMVVVKILRKEFGNRESVELFFREARIASQINHPNIVQIIDFGTTDDGLIFIVVEYLRGQTVAQLLQQRSFLPLENVVWLMEQICAGATAIHRLNIVHRDLKPSNIVVSHLAGGTTVAKLLDFGVSKPLNEADLDHTRSGAIMGTPGYLAPEQIEARAGLDSRADIYALGAILYFLISGQRPFAGESGQAIMSQQLTGRPKPLHEYGQLDQRNLPLEFVINRCLCREPSQRYADAAAMLSDIHAIARQSLRNAQNADGEPPDYSQYQFVCSGELVQGKSKEQVATALQEQLGITSEHCQLLLIGQRIVVKKDIDRDQARKYQQAFLQAGAMGHIEEMLDATRIQPLRSRDELSLSQPICLPTEDLNPPGAIWSADSYKTNPGKRQSGTLPAAKPQLTLPPEATPALRRHRHWGRYLIAAALLGILGIAQFYPQARYRLLDYWAYFQGGKEVRGISPERITIGMSAAFSGPAKELGRAIQTGILARLDEINANGGIHGRSVVLRALDDGYEPARTQDNLRQFLANNGVFALLGNVGTPTTEAILPSLLENHMLLFGPLTGAGILRQNPADRYVFNFRASYADETAALVKHLIDIRGIAPQHIGALIQNDGFGKDGLQGIRDALQHSGIKTAPAHLAYYERNSGDIAHATRYFLDAERNVGAIIIVGTYDAASTFISEMRRQGYRGLFANVSFVDAAALADNINAKNKAAGEGVVVSQVVPMPTGFATGILRYRKALQEYFPNERPGHLSLEGYIAASIFCEALQRVGRNLTVEKLVDELEQMRQVDLGIGEPISYSPSDHQGSHRVWGTQLNHLNQLTPLKLGNDDSETASRRP